MKQLLLALPLALCSALTTNTALAARGRPPAPCSRVFEFQPLIPDSALSRTHVSVRTEPLNVQTRSVLQMSHFEKLFHAGHQQTAIWDSERAKDEKLAQQLQTLLDGYLSKDKVYQITENRKNGGASISYLVKLSTGVKAIFKPAVRANYQWGKAQDASYDLVNPSSEVLAYLISQELQLNIVPMTTIRTINGVIGSLQVYVPNDSSRIDQAQTAKLQILDYLIDNKDRKIETRHNTLSFQGRVIAIDHSLAFQNFPPADNDNAPPTIDEIQLRQNFSEALLNRLENHLTEKSLKAMLSPHMPQFYVEEALLRRQHLVKELKMIYRPQDHLMNLWR